MNYVVRRGLNSFSEDVGDSRNWRAEEQRADLEPTSSKAVVHGGGLGRNPGRIQVPEVGGCTPCEELGRWVASA